jgi:hypothetical protein
MTELKDLFQEAFKEFLCRERDNILNNVNERNLCARLAMYVDQARQRYKIEGYYADVEYNRKQNGQIKTILDDQLKTVVINCDLILHSRGEIRGRDNLIAIEMKKVDQPRIEKSRDQERLRALTKASYDDMWSADGLTIPEHVCGYEIGFFILLDIPKARFAAEEYQGGKQIGGWEGAF